LTGAETLTNKRITPRIYSTSSASSLTPEIDTYDIFEFTALAEALTINNHSTSTPANGEMMMFIIKDNGTSRTISWGSNYQSVGATLPTTTTAGKWMYIGLVYNSAASKFDCVAVAIQGLGNYLENIVEDTTPELGGNLDAKDKNITGIGSAGIGTTSPSAKLDVIPSTSSEMVFRTASLQSTAPLGDELVSNGTFDNSSDWTWGTGWSWDSTNKEADHTTGNTAALTQTISVTSGTTYQVEITIKNRTAGSVTLDINGVYIYDYGSSTALYSNTTYRRSLVANITGSATLSITPTADFNGSVDDITVKAITGVSQPNFSLIDDAGSVVAELRGKNSISNLAVGTNALRVNTTGYSNSALGTNAMRYNTTGSSNSAAGSAALYSNTTGYNNSALGTNAMRYNTTGSSNSALGVNAGRYTSGGGNNKTSNNSVYLGYDTRASADGNTNEIVIGASAIGNGSNSVTLGNDSITKTILKGNVGIGTTNPSYKLDVNGALRLQPSSAPTGSAGVIYYDSTDGKFKIYVGGTWQDIVGTTDSQDLSNKNILTSINTQTGTSYTLVLSDAGKLVQMNNSSSNTLTIPTNASVAFPVGTKIMIQKYGSGNTTIQGASGVTLRDPNSLATISTQYDMRTIMKIGTDEWVIQ